jgi:hypothetical protein
MEKTFHFLMELSMSSPSHTPFETTTGERGMYLGLITVGILVFITGIVLEFTFVTDPTTHGLWTTISLLGLGIATVFGLIVRMPQKA